MNLFACWNGYIELGDSILECLILAVTFIKRTISDKAQCGRIVDVNYPIKLTPKSVCKIIELK